MNTAQIAKVRDCGATGGSGCMARGGEWRGEKLIQRTFVHTVRATVRGRLGLFLLPIVAAAGPADAPVPTDVAPSAVAPYPPSPVISRVAWAPVDSIVRLARGSDNWPMTWADDDALYTAYGDGNGFAPYVESKLSMGLARVSGVPPEIRGENLRSDTAEAKGDGKRGRKASGMLCIAGRLYVWVRNAGNSQLGWSDNHGVTWTWADWRFTESFGCPTFLNFGPDYAGARDRFVYTYSVDSETAYDRADLMVLARVPKGRLAEREAYEFFVRLDEAGQPVWNADIAKRGPVFEHKSRCYRSGITYCDPLRRYLWVQVLPGGDARFEGGFGIYDAPEPWGPWTTVFFTESWDVGPGESASFPTKWMSADGRAAWLVFSGDDHFSVRRATFDVVPSLPGAPAHAHETNR